MKVRLKRLSGAVETVALPDGPYYYVSISGSDLGDDDDDGWYSRDLVIAAPTNPAARRFAVGLCDPAKAESVESVRKTDPGMAALFKVSGNLEVAR